MHLEHVRLKLQNCPTSDYYPFNLEILQETKKIDFKTPVTFFVGENGSGKSTLLKAMAEKCQIHIWHGSQRLRYGNNPYESQLHKFIDVKWQAGPVPGSYFDSELSHNFAQLLDEWAVSDPGLLDYFGGESLMSQSHGQSMMSFFKARYRFKGLYLMDEPETALSPRSQAELAKVLAEMSAAGHAQFIVATHSPILMACPQATIYNFDSIPVEIIDYETTQHFTVFRDFMANWKTFFNDSQ
jgi:predicted ATPase